MALLGFILPVTPQFYDTALRNAEQYRICAGLFDTPVKERNNGVGLAQCGSHPNEPVRAVRDKHASLLCWE